MSFWKKSAGVFDFSLRISLTKVISIDDVINWVTELAVLLCDRVYVCTSHRKGVHIAFE